MRDGEAQNIFEGIQEANKNNKSKQLKAGEMGNEIKQAIQITTEQKF